MFTVHPLVSHASSSLQYSRPCCIVHTTSSRRLEFVYISDTTRLFHIVNSTYSQLPSWHDFALKRKLYRARVAYNNNDNELI